jgi:hypothetical protein
MVMLFLNDQRNWTKC